MEKEEYFKELGRQKIKEFSFVEIGHCEESDLLHLIRYCPDLESIEFPFQTDFAATSLLKNFRCLSSVIFDDALTFSEESFDEIFALPHLRTLEICNHRLDKDFCEKLARCEQLTSLSLSGCEYFGDQHLQALTPLRNLKRLDIGGSFYLTEEGFKSITAFSHLIRLGIASCPALTNESMKSVGAFTQLEVLNLAGASIDQMGFGYLEPLTQLKVLNVRACKGLDDIGMQSLREFKNIQQLAMGSCRKVSELGFSYLPEFIHLTHLDVSRTNISDRNLLAISALPALGSLSLGSCQCLTASGFAKIDQIQGLIDLELSYCDAVDDDVLMRIALISSLQTIDLTGCHQNITDVGLEYLSTHPKLCHLTLKHCDQITRNGLFRLARGLSELSSIIVAYCKNISASDIEEFKREFPKVQVFG